MRLIDIGTIINILVGLSNIAVAAWQLSNDKFEGMIYNMLLAICSFLVAIMLAIISNRK